MNTTTPIATQAANRLLITAEEMHELTGYKYASKQINWLKSNQMPFTIGGDGKPKVLQQVVVTLLGGVVENTHSEPALHL